MADHVQYLKDLAQRFYDGVTHQRGIHDEMAALLDGFKDLDRKDFAPDAQCDFVVLRSRLMRASENLRLNDGRDFVPKIQALVAVLDKYGPAAQAPTRIFRWLNDADLRRIVERDYIEVSKLTMPSGAWKSTVIMAGSITEAILFDLITKDAARFALAQASPKAPTKSVPASAPLGAVPAKIPFKKWRLEDLIALATDINLIQDARAATFDQVLRDYRNFVHPTKELRAEHHCGEGEALMAKGALDALCDHFDRTLP